MLIIEMAKIELIGFYIGFMLIVEMAKIESTGGHIKIMLFIEITKIKLTGGHIEASQTVNWDATHINHILDLC